jgi:predicted PhzF superfamily epimerase YddE/YHI9
MTIPFYIVDVFTEKNMQAINSWCFNAQDLTSDQMQEIAREINFAEVLL